MIEIFVITMAFPLAYLIVTLLYKKSNIFSILFVSTIAIYFIGVILRHFFVISYGADINIFIFPDETTYIYGESTGFFGDIMKFIVSVGSVLSIRFLNVFSYVFGLLWLTTELIQSKLVNKSKINYISFGYICIIAAFGSYWSFFVLKEGLSILSISLYLISYNRKNTPMKLIAICLALVVRFEVAAAIIFAELVVFLWKRSKKVLFALLVLGIVFIIIYINSSYSEAIKLRFLARRYGEGQKLFDIAARETAKLNFLRFITSYEYFETVSGNFLRSLIPFYYPFSPISTPLTVFNLLGSILMFANLKRRMGAPIIFGVTIFILLMATISVARYVTVIIIPLSIYFLLSQTKQEKTI